jgi:hypothetical protein
MCTRSLWLSVPSGAVSEEAYDVSVPLVDSLT